MKILLCLLVISCGSVNDKPDAAAPHNMGKPADARTVDAMVQPRTDGPSLTKEQMLETCLHTGQILCRRISDCQIQPYDYCYQDYLFNCPAIVDIRNYQDLTETCWEWLGSVRCTTLAETDFRLDPSCVKQFVIDAEGRKPTAKAISTFQ